MTQVQIIGIAVAAIVVVLLVIALVLTRRRHTSVEEPPPAAQPGSFLDAAPQDTFSDLGRAEQTVEEVTIDPGASRATPSPAPAQTPSAPTDDRLRLDWSAGAAAPPSTTPVAPSAGAQPASPEPPVPAAAPLSTAPEEAPQPPRQEAAAPAQPELENPAETTADLPTVDAGSQPPASSEPAAEAATGASTPQSRQVALSDIIVTTSSKMVNLDDPEVRRMLADLVTFEIDQAEEFRRQGQTIDAVLQLTEAEKVSRALGMSEAAERIRRMMQEIRGRG